MKKYIFLTIIISVLFTFQSVAQGGNSQRSDARRNQIKGPAAKNYKPWNGTASVKTILVKQPMDLKGPKAKNHKSWKEDYEMSSVLFVEPNDIKGPNAKNQKQASQTKYLSDSIGRRRR